MNDANTQSLQESYRPSSPHSKRALLVWLIIVMAFSPLVMAFFYDTFIEYLLAFFMSGIIYFWCRYDAAEVGKKIPWIVTLAILFVVALGFPLYLVRVRRFPIGQAVSIMFFWILLYVGIFYSSVFLMQFVFG